MEVELLHPELTEDPMTDDRMALVELRRRAATLISCEPWRRRC